MDRLLLAAVLVAAAVAVAVAVQRRRPAPAPAPSFAVPEVLDRADFARPGHPWLVVAFTSATCDTCASVVERLGPLASDQVAVQVVEAGTAPALHRRYGIGSVPLVVVADGAGVVRAHAFGPQTSAALWSLVAEARGDA